MGRGGAECPEGLGGFHGAWGVEGLGTYVDVGHRGSLGHVRGCGLYTKSDRVPEGLHRDNMIMPVF